MQRGQVGVYGTEKAGLEGQVGEEQGHQSGEDMAELRVEEAIMEISWLASGT